MAWVEAVAFCRWLSAKLGYEVRLPTEWEWQQAATGGDPANEYPWGPWDSSRANTYESELQRSTAVGMYPQGISPVEALDMSGNLWEYCLNEYDNPKRIEVSGEKSRAVRGGVLGRQPRLARCAYRDVRPPLRPVHHRRFSVGVRVPHLLSHWSLVAASAAKGRVAPLGEKNVISACATLRRSGMTPLPSFRQSLSRNPEMQDEQQPAVYIIQQ